MSSKSQNEIKTTTGSSGHLKATGDAVACDRTLHQTFKYVSPTGPYLLRLPPGAPQIRSSNPFWRRDTPFDEHEEELQYMTFRQDMDGSILQPRGDWDDGEGGLARPGESMSRTSSSRTPLPNQPPKKKISLADYHNLQKTKPKTTEPAAAGAKLTSDSKPHIEGKCTSNQDGRKDKDLKKTGEEPVQKPAANLDRKR